MKIPVPTYRSLLSKIEGGGRRLIAEASTQTKNRINRNIETCLACNRSKRKMECEAIRTQDSGPVETLGFAAKKLADRNMSLFAYQHSQLLTVSSDLSYLASLNKL